MEDQYFAKKVKAFDSDKMYARNEARRASCQEAPFGMRGSSQTSQDRDALDNSLTTFNKKRSIAINRNVF